MNYAWKPMDDATVKILGYELCWARTGSIHVRCVTLRPFPPNIIGPKDSDGHLVLCRVEQSVETGLIRRIPVKDTELPVADE